MHITFIGKKSILNECIIKEPDIIAEVQKLLMGKQDTDYVFTYNVKGKNRVIKATEINNWLKQYDESFTSKMFRTYDANILFIKYIRLQDVPITLTRAKRKKIVVSAINTISTQINNTPAICRREYLQNELEILFLDHPKKFNSLFINTMPANTCYHNYLKKVC